MTESVSHVNQSKGPEQQMQSTDFHCHQYVHHRADCDVGMENCLGIGQPTGLGEASNVTVPDDLWRK